MRWCEHPAAHDQQRDGDDPAGPQARRQRASDDREKQIADEVRRGQRAGRAAKAAEAEKKVSAAFLEKAGAEAGAVKKPSGLVYV
ncbi:MAG: FKBP-type peptidyl-prolyl cis-trans isomerase N-terminal domain-containing protein, partial [Actinomycetes bacterium]